MQTPKVPKQGFGLQPADPPDEEVPFPLPLPVVEVPLVPVPLLVLPVPEPEAAVEVLPPTAVEVLCAMAPVVPEVEFEHARHARVPAKIDDRMAGLRIPFFGPLVSRLRRFGRC